MITAHQLKNFKGMRTYGELDQIKGELVDLHKKLYDMDIDTSEAMDDVIRTLNSVHRIMENM